MQNLLRNTFSSLTVLVTVLLAAPGQTAAYVRDKPTIMEREVLADIGGTEFGRDSYHSKDGFLSVTVNHPNATRVAALVRLCPNLKELRLDRFPEEHVTSIVDSLARLPHLRTLHIFLIDNVAEEIGELNKLTALSLAVVSLTDRGVASLKRLDHVETLHLNLIGKETYQAGARVLKCFPHLKGLDLGGLGVSEETVRALGTLADLRSLDIVFPEDVSSNSLTSWRRLTMLKRLSISSPLGSRPDEYCVSIGHITSLQELSIFANISDKGVQNLSKLAALEFLHLSTKSITDQCLPMLKGLRNLRELHLFARGLTGSGFRHLGGLGDLKKLKLYQTAFQPEHVHHLAKLKCLEYLDLAWTPVEKGDGWKSLASLSSLPKLQTIWIEVPSEAHEELRKQLPDVEVYYYE